MANNRKIAGLIVAAGYSTRMGAYKPLLPLGELTIVETAVNSLRQGGIQDIRVVTGYQAEKIEAVLERWNVRTVHNPGYSDGMFSSVLAGIRSLEADTEAFLLLPGDNPLIRRHSIKEIVRTYRETNAAVVYPVFNGKRGHPPLIGSKCYASILAGDGCGGLRNVLTRFDSDLAEVNVADQGILIDIDTIDDYRNLINYYLRRNIPTHAECQAMLDKYQADGRVLRHGQAVASIACALAASLNQAGCRLDLDLVAAGGLIHDLAKGKPNHSQRGGRMAACMGFSALSAIIASHMDISFSRNDMINEAAIVFLADKLVQGEKRVSFLERFRPAFERFSDSPEVMSAVARRMQAAETIGKKTLELLGIADFDELAV